MRETPRTTRASPGAFCSCVPCVSRWSSPFTASASFTRAASSGWCHASGGARQAYFVIFVIDCRQDIAWHGHLEPRRDGLAGRSLSALFLAGIHREKIERETHLDAALDGFALESLHALLEQLAVKLESDGGDVAALLGTEDVARAANLEVAHGNLESAAEL